MELDDVTFSIPINITCDCNFFVSTNFHDQVHWMLHWIFEVMHQKHTTMLNFSQEMAWIMTGSFLETTCQLIQLVKHYQNIDY